MIFTPNAVFIMGNKKIDVQGEKSLNHQTEMKTSQKPASLKVMRL